MKRFFFFSFTLVSLFGWQAEATPGAGCDTSRTAVVHHADGSLLANQSGAPFPCGVKVANGNFGGDESRVAVAPNGDVLETPAITVLGPQGHPLPDPTGVAPTPESVFSNNSGIGWTTDNGATWALITPNDNLYIQGDNDLYIDHDTGRLYYNCLSAPFPPPLNDFNPIYVPTSCVMSSPALPGGGWSAVFSRTDMVGWLSENPRFTSGIAPAGQPQPVPGENMGYWCASMQNAPSASQRTCHRTFDGGQSWQFASFIHQNPIHAHSVCTGATSETMDFPRVGPDGSLWGRLSCDSNHYLMKSTDLAATWQVVTSLPPGGTIRVDSDGNLYLYAGRELRTSQDGGQTWSAPSTMLAPAARGPSLRHNGFHIGYQPGHAATAYYVQRPDGDFDAYITLTHNALDPNPVFYSARINPANRPMLTAASGSGPPDDFITLDIGPDGTPWAAIYSSCFRNTRGEFVDAYCRATRGERTFQGAPWINAAKVMTMGSLQW